ncbi:MAG: hypothetical protein JSR37_06610 [Verrucomicrobia bacterium]|nr:hypothetical protein [Verrucomicrobiota bacterium]
MKINTLLSEIKSYSGPIGWVLHLFGRTVRVGSVYLHKDQLIQALFKAAHYQATAQERKAVSDSVLEMLNPVVGKELTMSKVKKRFEEFATACSRREPSFERIKQKLDECKLRKLAVFKLNDPTFVERLQPGDLLFKKNPADSDNLVVRAQKITRLFTFATQRDREGYKYSHVAIYLGNNEVAEAVTDSSGAAQIRKINIFDPRFIKPNSQETFTVTRAKNREMAEGAADVARKIAITPSADDSDHPHRYAFLNALRSLWHPITFGPFAKVRYLKQYVDDQNDHPPTEFMNPRNFYCSQLVGHCYQTAESRTVVPEILGDTKPKHSKSMVGHAVKRTLWARVSRWKHYRTFDQRVQMSFDSKWMNPQDFRNFIVSNKELFKDRIYLAR